METDGLEIWLRSCVFIGVLQLCPFPSLPYSFARALEAIPHRFSCRVTIISEDWVTDNSESHIRRGRILKPGSITTFMRPVPGS